MSPKKKNKIKNAFIRWGMLKGSFIKMKRVMFYIAKDRKRNKKI